MSVKGTTWGKGRGKTACTRGSLIRAFNRKTTCGRVLSAVGVTAHSAKIFLKRCEKGRSYSQQRAAKLMPLHGPLSRQGPKLCTQGVHAVPPLAQPATPRSTYPPHICSSSRDLKRPQDFFFGQDPDLRRLVFGLWLLFSGDRRLFWFLFQGVVLHSGYLDFGCRQTV